MRILLTFAFFLLCGVGISAQKIYRVNTTDDVDDGQCDNVHCSLREAINSANTDGIESLLWFELNGTGLKVIDLQSALPAITEDNLLIDGTTLASNLPTAGRLIIDGQASIENCLDIQSSNIRIYGLQIQNFKESAILIKNTSLDIARRVKIGRRKQGNIFLNNGYAVNAENVSDLEFKSNYVGTNLNFEQGYGNRNGVIVKNDWEDFVGTSIVIGGEIDNLDRNYFVNCSETAVDLSYQGAGIIEGNIFGTGRTGTEQMGNNVAVKVSNLHGRIDIGGSQNTKNIFAYNKSAVIVDKNNFIRVSENSFYCNELGLSIIENPHPTPLIDLAELSILSGQSQPNDFVEIYITDAETCNSEDCQGMTYLGITTANTEGKWDFQGNFKYGQQLVALSRKNGRQSMFSECFILCPTVIEAAVANTGPYCTNDAIELSITPSFSRVDWVDFSNDDITYEWFGPSAYNSEDQNPVTATQQGQYIAQAYVLGCPSIPDTTEVLVTNLTATIEAANTYCRADSITLNSKVTSNASSIRYQWTGPNNYTSIYKNPIDVKDSGEYNLIITGNGCTSEVSSITIENHFPESYSLGTSTTVCNGEAVNLNLPTFNTYQWSGDFDLACDTCQSISFTPSESGTISVNLGPTATCYASANLAINVLSPVSNTEERILCPGSSLNLLAQNITEPGTYSSKFIGANGCDSTQTFIIIQPQANKVIESKTICEGETLQKFGQTYATTGVYEANFIGANGCDSTHTLELTVLTKAIKEESYSICAGESMSIFGVEMSETTTQTKTFTGASGCDSVHTIHLLVKETFNEADKITLCAGETTNILDGLVVSESGVYEKAFVSSLGCDSMVRIEVAVMEPISSVNIITMCDKDAVATFGDLSAVPTAYEEIYTAQSGCDSTISVSYNITTSQDTEESVTICSADQYLIDGKEITESGRYVTAYSAANGCDSIHTIELKVLTTSVVEESYAICTGESMSIFGTEMSETTTQTKTFIGANGCDSVHTIHLLVKETFNEADKIILCAGETTNILDGLAVSESGVYEKAFVSSLGCDSMVLVNVEVMEPITSYKVITMCEEEAIAVFGEESAIPSDYVETFTAQSGCDSIHYVSYNITTSQDVEESVTICATDQFLIDGKAITASGRYETTYSAVNGCDSVHITNVTILSSLTTSATYELCAGEEIDVFGKMVNVSGTFSNSFTATSGCDSLHTVTVLVKESRITNESITICEGETITVFDKLISDEEQLSRTFSGANGCDSTHSIQVNVLKKVFSEANESLCQANCINLYGATACGNNLFQQTLTASSGCDSIHTVNLTITESDEVLMEYTVCEGDSIEALGTFIKEEGTFSKAFITANGCDSIHTVNLKITKPTTIVADYMLCPGDSLAAFGTFIKEAGTFSKTFIAANGCDSVHTVNLVITESIEVVSEYMICEGDSIAALGAFIKEVGAFSKTYSSSSGCDSTHTVVVNFSEPITANISTSPACPENANGQLELIISGGEAPYQVDWNGSDVGTTTALDNLLAGAYTLSISDAMGCKWEEHITIESALQPVIETNIMDVSCFGDADGSITLSSDSWVEFSLDGINFNQSPIFSDLSASAYEVTFKDELGCVFREVVEVLEPVQMEVSLPEVTTINLGTSLTLEPSVIASNAVSYEWSDAETLSCLGCENPVASPLQDTKYIVTVYDENNCESQAETWVKIEFNKGIYVPNVFSPDNDGQNDIFTIQAAEGPIEEVEFFKVYDRWGTLLYEANNFHPNDEGFGWDGSYRGQNMGNGVYIYLAVVKFKDGSETQVQGDVTLVK